MSSDFEGCLWKYLDEPFDVMNKFCDFDVFGFLCWSMAVDFRAGVLVFDFAPGDNA